MQQLIIFAAKVLKTNCLREFDTDAEKQTENSICSF